MARLEFEFVSVGAKNVDNELNNIRTSFSNVNGLLKDNIKDSIAYSNTLKEVTSKLKMSGGANETLVKQQIELRGRLNDVNATIKQQIKDFDSVDGSLAQLRANLSLANKAYDNLSKTARQGNIGTQLGKQIQSLNQEISNAEQATGRFQRQVGNYSKGQANANGVALEFNRIIQDAPFGMMGVANNIQQLFANWGYYAQRVKEVAQANGTTVTSMTLLRGAMGSVLSTGNLLTLGVSLVTSGWTYYTMWQQKANKATREARSEMDTLRDSLSKYNQAMAEGESKGKIEEARLNRLMSIYKDINQSQKTRKNAYQEIISMYESYFGKLSEEEKRTFDLSKAYDRLSVSILKTAKARAYQDIIEQNIKDIEVLNKSIEGTSNSIIKSTNALNKFNKETKASDFRSISGQGGNMNVINQGLKVSSDLNNSLIENKKLVDQRNRLTAENYSYEQKILELSIEGAKIAEVANSEREKSSKSLKESFDYLSKIRDLISGRQKDIDLINLDGQAKDLKELEYKWQDYFKSITDLQNKLNKDKSVTDRTTIQNALNNATELGNTLQGLEQNEILKKYSDERQDIIREMNEKVGILEDSSREKDLKSFQKYLDDKIKVLVSKGAIISELQSELDKISFAGQYNINVKWDSKELEEWGKINDQIQDTIDKPFTARNREGIQRQIEARIITMRKLLQSISKAMNVPFDENEFNRLSNEIKIQGDLAIDLNKAKTDIREYVNIANQGLNSLFSSLNTNVQEFGFGLSSVLFSIADTFKNVIDGLNSKNTNDFMENLTRANEKGVIDIKSNWTEIKNDSVKMSQAIGVAMSTVGNLVSNITSKTSVAGQGIGGALSGAGAGMAFGPWGAAIGGAIGLIGGIFGAKRARKQERLQQQQLAEQKKANALLERMNALAYASSVIGGRTEYGVVSGVNRNEFGELTFRIQGKDLVASLDRTQQKTNR